MSSPMPGIAELKNETADKDAGTLPCDPVRGVRLRNFPPADRANGSSNSKPVYAQRSSNSSEWSSASSDLPRCAIECLQKTPLSYLRLFALANLWMIRLYLLSPGVHPPKFRKMAIKPATSPKTKLNIHQSRTKITRHDPQPQNPISRDCLRGCSDLPLLNLL
jgi:hypothetical protein